MSLPSNADIVNYYEILEISPRASSSEIYEAYTNIKQIYSPQNPEVFRTFNIEELQQLMTLIEEAYSTVGQKKTRDLYDGQLFKAYPELGQLNHIDFTESEDTPIAPIETSTILTETLPDGWAKTTLSTYEIDEAFEAMIENQDHYDGAFLNRVRKYKKIKLEQFSKHTCINIKHLHAIESDNFSALPARVFVQGYIRQYCKVLNINSDEIVSSYITLYENGRQ